MYHHLPVSSRLLRCVVEIPRDLIELRSEGLRFFVTSPNVFRSDPRPSILGGAIWSGTGYPEPGGLHGNGGALDVSRLAS